ncbi:MAG: hypothetical protein K5649_05760 [Lachnospiraceae bacterium]|nr:hypothetical protein [Lachnospiraceae bacterium]
MKYCKKCGMLLEDTVDICIGCGTDVTDPDNVSKYPPNMEKKIEAEKKQNKMNTTTIIAIIVVFVLLISLIILIVFMSPRVGGRNSRDRLKAQTTEETPQTAEVTEEPAPEEVITEEEPVTEEVIDRNVKDEQGSYYVRSVLLDEGGNLIFTGLYPEDFVQTQLSVDYSFCSNRLPGYVTFIADDPENSVRFIYFSPQHFWNKVSDNRSSLKDGEDPLFQMTFGTYDDGKTYIEKLIKTSYPKAKKIEMVESWEAGDEIKEQLSEIAKAFKKQINTHVDYAHLGEDTEYAPMNSEAKALFYRYEVLIEDKTTLFMQFYVPMIANNIVYSTESRNDHGTMIEWMCLGVYGMAAGNEDLYDDYQPAFQVFMDNCNVNQTFYHVLEQRCKDLEKTIQAEEEAEDVTAAKLGEYGKDSDAELSDFDRMLYVFTTMRGGDKIFKLGDTIVNGPADTSVAFLNREKERVFISPAEDEFPGSGYEDMVLDEDTEKLSADDVESQDKEVPGNPKDKDKDKDKDKTEGEDDESDQTPADS